VPTIAAPHDGEEHARMAPDETVPKTRRSPWLWVSVGLAIVAAGLLVWGLTIKSDRDSAQEQLSNTQQQLDKTKDELASATPTPAQAAEDDSGGGRPVLAAGALVGMKAVYDDLAGQLGATQEDLAATQDDLDAANEKAAKAEKDAAAAAEKAKQADNETDKAKAEADQAKAEAEATKSKAAVATDCAKAYVSALGGLFEGDNPEDQSDAVREQVAGITDDCNAAMDGK
jgi:type IV secretory pathway VirB10-like protein